MRVLVRSKKLQALLDNPKAMEGLSPAVLKAFRKKYQSLIGASNLNTVRGLGGNHLEKLKGARSHQYSIRLNIQFRLIMEIERDDKGDLLLLIDIEDYH